MAPTVTVRDREHVAAVLSLVARAFREGDRSILDQLPAIRATLEGVENLDLLRTEHLRTLERVCYELQEPDPLPAYLHENAVQRAHEREAGMLGESSCIDSRFAALPRRRLREALLEVKDGSKGAPDSPAMLRVAAELAVEVDAFGFAKTGRYGTDVEKARSASRAHSIALRARKIKPVRAPNRNG